MASRTVNFVVDSATAKLVIWEQDARATLSNVFSRQPNRGHGTSLMETICKYVDDEFLLVILEVQQYHYRNDEGLNNQQLVEFYRKFGFEVIPRNGRAIWMRRYPF